MRAHALPLSPHRHFTVIWDWLLALTDAMDEEEDDEAAAALKLTYHWRTTAWKNIRVGDIIRLQNDEPIPADVILLSTSEPDCVCYVETKNLDGETSLKLKQGAVETSWLDRPEDCATRLRLHIESEPPTTNMLRYQATLHLPFDVPGTNTVMSVDMPASASPLSPSGEKRPSLHKRSPIAEVVAVTSPVAFDSLAGQSGVQAVDAIATRTEDLGAMGVSHTKHLPVDVNGLLHRGAVLRNTKWAIGVIVFTGEDTKQVMNAGDTPSKRSHVEKLMNPHMYVVCMYMV